MLELQYEQDGNILKKVHVTRDGQTVSTVVEKFSQSFDWYLFTRDHEAQARLLIVGEFVLVVTNRFAPCSADAGFTAGIHLAFTQEEPALSWCGGQELFWATSPLQLFERVNSAFGQDPPHKWLAAQLLVAQNLKTFNGAIYLENPSISCNRHYKEGDFVDTTSKGRWLFPHPDGSRSAFEHMQKTTFEDDFERLMPYFEEHPELMETFSDLI